MAQKYVLTISGKGEKEMVLGAEADLREVDINILENVFYAAANSYKTPADIHLCLDFLGQLKAIGDKTEIVLDSTDKKNLEKGIELTATHRPYGWFASKLWGQFVNMTPVKE